MAVIDHNLLRTQKNEIFLLIKAYELNPEEFDWEEQYRDEEHDSSDEMKFHFSRLIHKPSGYSAFFGEDFVSYSPGSENVDSTEKTQTWVSKCFATRRWLSNLKRETDAPDLWDSLYQGQELLSLEPSANTPFTPDEQIHIKKAIEEIRIYITTNYTPEAGPLERINRKLDYLIDASSRLGRIDWKNIFVAGLFGLALQHFIPFGPGLRELLGAAGRLLRHLLGGIISPHLIP